MQTITHIVPQFPKIIDGIGDYAFNLAVSLRERHGVRSRFIVGDPTWPASGEIDGFPVTPLKARRTEAVREALLQTDGESVVLLHYVGYGYHRRGVPAWLVRGIESWQADFQLNRWEKAPILMTMFHELWSTGHLWQSAFYLHAWQRSLVCRLHLLSFLTVTSTPQMHRLLEAVEPRESRIFPVPSNFSSREPRLASSHRSTPPYTVMIFGQTRTRLATIKVHRPLLEVLHRQGWLERVVVAGKDSAAELGLTEGARQLLEFLPPERIQVLGELSPERVGEAFQQVDFFLSSYFAFEACKSGAFMAAVAAGCPAVFCDRADASPLTAGGHFLACDGSEAEVLQLKKDIESGALARVSAEAFAWYRKHADWPVVSDNYQALLEMVEGAQGKAEKRKS